MVSNPKIPSKTLFVLSHSQATSFPRCLPSFTLTGTACLPPRCQWDWRGLTSTPLAESQRQGETRWKNSQKKRVLSRLVAVLLTSSPSPLPWIYSNTLYYKRTQRMKLVKKKKNLSGTISLSFGQTLSLSPVKRSSVLDEDRWLNFRKRTAPQRWKESNLGLQLEHPTEKIVQNTQRVVWANWILLYFTFDSFYNKSEKNREHWDERDPHGQRATRGICSTLYRVILVLQGTYLSSARYTHEHLTFALM